MATAAIALGPWGRGQERPGLGNTNPFEMMHDMLGIRNEMQTYNAGIEAGQIRATSGSDEEALTRMGQSPNSAWMGPAMKILQEKILMEAQRGEITARTTHQQITNGMDVLANAAKVGNTRDAYNAAIEDGIRSLDPATRATQEKVIRDGAAPALNATSTADFGAQVTAQRIALAGLSPEHAFAAGGGVPPTVGEIPGTAWTEPGIGIRGGYGTLSLFGPGGGAGAGVIPGPVRGEPEEARRISEESSKSVPEIISAQADIRRMNDLLDYFEPGAFAKERKWVSAELRGINNLARDIFGYREDIISPDFIEKLGNKSLTGSQLFDYLRTGFIANRVRGLVEGTGTGRLQAEVGPIWEGLGEGSTPETVRAVLNMAQWKYAAALERAQRWPEFRASVMSGRDPETRGLLPSQYNTYFNQKYLPAINQRFNYPVDQDPFKGAPEKPQRMATPGGEVKERQPDGTWKTIGRVPKGKQ